MAGNAMRRVSLRNLAAHKVRLALTVLSVVLGTSFVAGSIVFTATISSAFNSIFDNVALGVDTRVSPGDEKASGLPDTVVTTLRNNETELGITKLVPRYSAPITVAAADGSALQSGGAPSIGTGFTPDNQKLSPTDSQLVAGRAPRGPGEITLNTRAAEKGKLKIGSTTTLVVGRGASTPQRVTVVGLMKVPSDTSGFINAQVDSNIAAKMFAAQSMPAYVEMAATPGVTSAELSQRVEKLIGSDYKVQTGAQVRDEEKDNVNKFLTVFNYILLAFAAIGLIVGTFIIYNTFVMIIAQRVRELALLRAIGAGRTQITRSVLLEAFIVGLIGGVVGLGVGIGIAAALKAITSANSGLPQGSLQITPTAVIACLAVGIIVTMVSAYAPARRAAKIAPVEAMREASTDGAASLRKRTVTGTILAVIALALLGIGTAGHTTTASLTVGLGALVMIVAVVLAAPALSRPAVGLLGRIVGKPFGTVGTLARTNAVRNPRRTAATAFALTLGLMLVAVVGTFGSSLKGSIDDTVNKNVSADIVLSASAGGTLPTSIVTAATQSPDVATAVAFRAVLAKVDGKQVLGGAPSGDFSAVTPYSMVSGTKGPIPDDGIIVSKKEADKKGWKTGQKVTFTSYDNTTTTVRVSGVFNNNDVLGNLQMGEGAYEKLVPESLRSTQLVLVKAKSGVSVDTLHANLDKATKGFLTVKVQSRAEFAGQASSNVDQMLAVLYSMLGLALVIAVLGIINTLALSVIERKREIGMLRAIGVARNQIRRTIYIESVLIAIFGAVLGVILGSAFGIAIVRTFTEQGITRAVLPYTLIIITLIAAAVVGVLAALWPASRAAKTNPLEAIATA